MTTTTTFTVNGHGANTPVALDLIDAFNAGDDEKVIGYVAGLDVAQLRALVLVLIGVASHVDADQRAGVRELYQDPPNPRFARSDYSGSTMPRI